MPREVNQQPETQPETAVSQEPASPPKPAPQRYLRPDEYIKTPWGRVIITDNREEAVDEIVKLLNRKREIELDVAQSKVGKRVLTDTVFAVEKRKGDYNNAVVVHGKQVKIIIPANMFFTQDYSMEQANKELDRRIGTDVDYIVTRYDTNDEGEIVVALASRAEAMRANAEIWFKGANGDAPKIQVGDIVQARVLSTFDYGFVAEVGGVETFVSYPRNAEPVEKGTNTLLHVLTIKTDSGDVSIRTEMYNASGAGFGSTADDFVIGSKYYGAVTGVRRDGFYVDLGNGVSGYCSYKAKTNDRPTIGQRVSLTVTKAGREKDFLFVRLNHIL